MYSDAHVSRCGGSAADVSLMDSCGETGDLLHIDAVVRGNVGINSSNTASAYQTSDVQSDVSPGVGTSITSMEEDGETQAQAKPRWFLDAASLNIDKSRTRRWENTPAGTCSSTKTEDSLVCPKEPSVSAVMSLDEKKLHPYGNSTAYP